MIVNLSVNCSCACVEENHGNLSMFLVGTLSYNAPCFLLFYFKQQKKGFSTTGEISEWRITAMALEIQTQLQR